MAWAPAAISLAGSAYSAIQGRKAGKGAEKAAKINAAYEVAETEQADMEAKAQIARQRWANRMFRGSQRAAIAGAGVVGTTGSALDAQAEAAAMQELQIQDMARTRETSRKAGYARAQVIRAGGTAQRRAYNGQATASLISGVGQAWGMYQNRAGA